MIPVLDIPSPTEHVTSTSLSPRRSALAVARCPQRAAFLALVSLMAVALLSTTVCGDYIFVANYGGPSKIGEYTTSGDTVNASLVSGSSYSTGMAASGSDLFVITNYATGTIGEYTTAGAVVNASLLTVGDPGALQSLDRTSLSRITKTARLANTPRRGER